MARERDRHAPSLPVKRMRAIVPVTKPIGLMKLKPEHAEDDVIDHDLILVWGEQKRIITGADLLGRLLRGIATWEVRQS